MSAVSDAFARAKAEGRAALVGYLPAGFPSVEATAYFLVAEALTNASRHSGADRVAVSVQVRGGRLCVRVTDDGRGGATEGTGSGLVGIRRRVAAHDGTMSLSSPPGGPTTLTAELPCGS